MIAVLGKANVLVERVQLPEPARVWVDGATGWAKDLRPVFESLAMRSTVRKLEGCGLNPAATIQRMLTMAPCTEMMLPLRIELRLADARTSSYPQQCAFTQMWAKRLSIVSGAVPNPDSVVTGDSSTWAEVLYVGGALGATRIDGDTAAVRRFVDAFAGFGLA